MIIVAGWLHVDRVDRDQYVAGCVAVVQQATYLSLIHI